MLATWLAAGASFDAQRQNIINGLTSAQSETHGWNNEVKAKIAVTDVVRTSGLVVTITLDAEAAYAITAQETITATVPVSAFGGAGAGIVASPTFTVDPVTTTIIYAPPLRIPNKYVGPQALRFSFRQPYMPLFVAPPSVGVTAVGSTLMLLGVG